MISEQAKSGIDLIFCKAARGSLVLESSDGIEIDRLAPGKVIVPPQQHLFMLTIASFHFKLLTIFHVDSDPVTARYFSRPDSNLGFDDIFPEVGNLCCGAMSRELLGHFPHLGLSTPYQLDRQCMPHLDVLRLAHVAQYRVTIRSDVTIHVTLCLRAYETIDFTFDPAESNAQETGSMEFF